MKKLQVWINPVESQEICIKDENGKKRIFRVGNIVPKYGHMKKIYFKEIDKSDYDKKIKEMAEYISSKINAEKMVIDAIKHLEADKLDSLFKKFKQKKKPKLREKDGCYNLVVGGLEIPVMD